MSCIITYNGQNFTQEDFLEYLKSQIPNNSQVKAKIPQNLVSGIEAFGTKQYATQEIKNILGENPTSIDMIEAGLRTRTTRSVGEMQKYNIEVGDIIEHFGKSSNGTTKSIKAKVTAIHYKNSPEFKSTWYKEGWTEEGLKYIERFKDGAAAIEFELLSNSNNPAEFTNHSGGAYGGDTFWDIIGREFGVTNHKHYKDAGNTNLSQQLKNKGIKAEILTEEQMEFARQKIKELLGIEYKDDLRGNLQVRNFYQVYNANAVYAVAKLDTNKGFNSNAVLGGTNTAVQLGIKLNKPVYVWDTNTEKWYKFNNQKNNLPTSSETINIYAGGNQNAELSNFAIRPFTINVETPSGEKQFTFQSVEQGFHFYKAMVANNPEVAKKILATTNGATLKSLTNRTNLPMTSEQVKEWDAQSKSVMLNLMYDSFAQNPDKAQLLLNTGDATITHTQDNTRWKTDFPEVVMTVRDMLKEEGFSNNEGIFQKTETPTLTKNFAGVGTRNIENYNTLDKTTNKWTPRKEYLGDAKAQAAQQAIRDVYEKTFKNQQLKQENKTTTSKPQSKDFITNKVNSSFDKYGYVDVLTSGKNNFDFKSAVIKYIIKDLGLEFKSDKELNNYLIKEKNEGRTFNLMQYVTLEELPDNKTRVKLNKRNLLLDSVEDFGPKSLGGLNFTSSGRDFESKNMFKNNIEQAFNCK